MTLDELGRRMGVGEFLRWMRYFADGDARDAAEMTPEQIAAAFGAKITG